MVQAAPWFQHHPLWKSFPSLWLKAGPQLFSISMKPVEGYRYVKWPYQRLAAQLLLYKTALNGPAPCVPSPSSDWWGWGLTYFSNISWTPWILDPITNPYLGPSSWLYPVSCLPGLGEAFPTWPVQNDLSPQTPFLTAVSFFTLGHNYNHLTGTLCIYFACLTLDCKVAFTRSEILVFVHYCIPNT